MRRVALLLLTAALLGGCGKSEEMPKQEYQAKAEHTTIAAKAFREGRDWSKLTPDEKAPFLSFYKNETDAKAAFDKIATGLKYFQAGGGMSGPPH